VDWIVEGTHPLAGHYHSKAEFIAQTFDKLDKVLPQGAELYVEHVLVSGDWAVVELPSDATTKNGLRFDTGSHNPLPLQPAFSVATGFTSNLFSVA
jgi:uncharacterized protein